MNSVRSNILNLKYQNLQHQIPKVYIFEFVPKSQFLYKLTVRKKRKIENRIPLLHLTSCKHLICRGLVFEKVLV